MITITSQPPSSDLDAEVHSPPVPVSDCWRWCLQGASADAITTPGSRATLTVTFPASPTVPADGTTFKIWNYDFTIQSGTPFMAHSFKVEATGVLTRKNFISMLSGNLFFSRAVSFTVQTISGSSRVIVTWNECREQPNFAPEHMDLAGLTATGATATYLQGISPVYVDNYRIMTALGIYEAGKDSFVLSPITDLVGIEPDKKCSSIGQVCPDYPEDAASLLYTDLPDLTFTSFIDMVQGGKSLMRLFAIKYGWAYREDCMPKSGTFMESPSVLGINAAFDVDDPYQMRRYWHDHPGGLPPDQDYIRMLTTQPVSLPLCWDSYKWLWVLNNWQDEWGEYRLVAIFKAYTAGGTHDSFGQAIFDPETDSGQWYQPINFNASPGYVLANSTLVESEIAYYEVRVVGFDPETEWTPETDPLFVATETLKFYPSHCCAGSTDIYFLGPTGAWETLVVNVTTIDPVREGTEIHLHKDCGATRLNRARYGGRSMKALRTFKQYSFNIQAPRNKQWEDYLTHFRQSPQHAIRVETADGFIAKKFILSSGSASVFNANEGLNFTGEGYLADIPVQAGTESLI